MEIKVVPDTATSVQHWFKIQIRYRDRSPRDKPSILLLNVYFVRLDWLLCRPKLHTSSYERYKIDYGLLLTDLCTVIVFSLFFVGWSRTEIGIELIVIVNVIVLMTVQPLSQGAVLTFATFGEGPIIAGLFHWLHNEGGPLIGPSGAYVVFSVGFAEMGALFLLLPALA